MNPSPTRGYHPLSMRVSRHLSRALCGVALASILGASACAKGFNLGRFRGTNAELYNASLREYRQKRYDNALAGFEKLSLDLPARDSLLPRVYFYLGRVHLRRREFLLAAQTFGRLPETFPEDSLADDALMETGGAYRRLWRKPTLDSQYGQSALSTYRLMLALYPASPRRDEALRAIAQLEDAFAAKDYQNAMFYMRRKAFDSAILYLKDVATRYPSTPHARLAQLRLVDAYRAVKYREEANEACAVARRQYVGDREVDTLCAGVAAAAADSVTPVTPAPASPPVPAAPPGGASTP